MSAFGDKPFGLSDVKLTSIDGGTQKDLPAARVLTWSERLRTGEMTGDDSLLAVVALSEAVEWSLESGGISLDAYALMTGRTATTAGTSPSQTATLAGDAAEHYPYFKIYGKSIADDAIADIHVKLNKCKLQSIEGNFSEGEFFVTSCTGLAVTNGTSIYEFVQNETATTLPTS